MDMDFFNSVNDITNTGFGSYVNPYEDPNSSVLKKITESNGMQPKSATPVESASATQQNKPEATPMEIAGKAADAFKQFGQSMGGNRQVNLPATPQIGGAPNLGGFVAMSAPQPMSMSPQISMPQIQVPQMQMGQPMAPLPIAMSDYRTKTKIQDASIKIDALLNKVYENLTNRK